MIHRVWGEAVDALELVGDAEDLAEDLHGGAGTAGCRFPASEEKQSRFVESGDCLDCSRQRGGDFGRLSEAAGRAINRDEFERTFWPTVIMTCCNFAFGARLTR